MASPHSWGSCRPGSGARLTICQERLFSEDFPQGPRRVVPQGGAAEGCSWVPAARIYSPSSSERSKSGVPKTCGAVTSSPNCEEVVSYMKSQEKRTARLVFTSGPRVHCKEDAWSVSAASSRHLGGPGRTPSSFRRASR